MEDLRKYLAIVVRWWWLLILLAIVAVGSSYVYTNKQRTVYYSSATIIVGQTIQSVDPTTGDIALSQQLALTYADLALRQPVLQEVVEALGLNQSWQTLRRQVQVRTVPNTQLLEISVTASSSKEAQIIANGVADQLILLSPTTLQNREQSESQRLIRQQISELQAKIESGRERVKVLNEALETTLSAQQIADIKSEIDTLESLITEWETNYSQLLIFIESAKSPNYLAIIEPAQPGIPIRPSILRNVLIGGFAGMLVALGLIFLLEYLDDTFKSVDDLNQSMNDVITLGTINRIKGKQYEDKLITTQGPFSPASEAYRIIRSNIQFMAIDQPLSSIIVTSPNPGEGKSVTVANLGMIMAQAGLKTIIVDADLRRPMMHEILRVPNHKGGLTGLLRSTALKLEGELKCTEVDGLKVLTSGVMPPNPAELLGSQRMRELLANLSEQAEMVIYDSPPVLAVADAAVLSNRVDGVVLVIESGRTRRDAAKQAVATLQQANANLLGVVLNRVSKKKGRYYHGYYYTPRPTTVARQTGHPEPKRRWQWLPFFK